MQQHRTFFLLGVVVALLALATALPLQQEQDLDDDFEDGVPLKCSVCRRTLGALQPLLAKNATTEVMRTLATPLCETIHATGRCHGRAACKELCKGIINEFAPMMINILFENGHTGTDQLCEIASVCPPQQAPPGPVEGAGLLLKSNLSDHSGERAWKQWQRPAGVQAKFLHLTDTHLDVFYAEGSNAECGNPICCRADNGPPPKGKRAAGHWGDYLCDLPPVMFESLQRELARSFQDAVDFVIVTGDEPPHDVWKQSQDINLNAIAAVTEGVKNVFKDVPTFFVLGNHAGYPINTFRDIGEDSWLYSAIAKDWADWLPADAIRTVSKGGYYAARARPGLRVVALHTTPLTSDDLWLRLNATPHDFTGQLPWFNDTMAQVRALGEKAYIIGHARPVEFVEPIKSAFMELAYEYRDVIAGYLFGHTHAAELAVMRRNRQEEPFAVAYTAGSVTTETLLNPGFRVWNYSRDTMELTGWDQYWVDLDEANKKPSEDPKWELRYHAPEHFGMPSLSPSAWVDMANRLKTDSGLNADWNVAKNKGGPSPPSPAGQNACNILQNETSCNQVVLGLLGDMH